jgi:ubiquinone/menaquinone biosynthesis C-methylase UbiE
MPDDPRICDYEGSDYRTDFWEGQGRDYEDSVERDVLARLLPSSGQRLLEVGAGFGRLTSEYRYFKQVVLLDYSFSQLQYAREQFGDEGYLYVAADAYKLPFQPGVFDAATMIRVLHHFERVPRVLKAIRRVLAPQAAFILEFANKRNLKALARYGLGQQKWDPNDPQPVEFVEMNYNFHPSYIVNELRAAGFEHLQSVPVSFLRSGLLKRTLKKDWLLNIDGVMQRSGLLVAPSIFTKSRASASNPDNNADNMQLSGEAIFACPQTHSTLQRDEDTLVSADGRRYAVREGIYDFKQALA